MENTKRRNRKRVGLFFLVFLMIGGIGFSCLYYFSQKPPEDELKIAREAITKARDLKADQYSPDLFMKATASYDSAMSYWKIQNQKLFFRRDYSEVIRFTSLSADFANQSVKSANHKKNNIHNNTKAKLSETEKLIQEFSVLYNPLPLNKKIKESYNKSKILFSESQIARTQEKLNIAEQKISEAKILIKKANTEADSYVQNYFSHYQQWKSQVQKTIDDSKKRKTTAIIINKFDQQCQLYKNGKLIKTFHSEFGPNWVGDKKRKGDNSTPEGLYHITRKKDGARTIYYKALLLDYPNQEDKNRFQQEVKAGKVSSKTDLGGLIEIHGHGGRNFNWTNGCIALTDEDMDYLFKNVSVNTPVTIVGSLKSFEEWKNDRLNQ